jgi:hypothetical protein
MSSSASMARTRDPKSGRCAGRITRGVRSLAAFLAQPARDMDPMAGLLWTSVHVQRTPITMAQSVHVGDPVPLLEGAELTCPRPPKRCRSQKRWRARQDSNLQPLDP